LRATQLSQTKDLAAIVRELGLTYEEFGSVLSGIADAVKPLRRLIGKPDLEGGAEGSRLVTAGMALIAFPDPTITDIAGITLVAAGLARNRIRPVTAADACREFREAIERIVNTAGELVY